MRVRRSIADAAFDGTAYRNAFAAAQARGDDYGYEYLAGIHGFPLPISCPHGVDIFLPWHRAYLMQFEISIAAYVPAFAIGVWDWRTPAGTAGEVPRLFQPTPGSNQDPLVRYAPNRLRPAERSQLVQAGALSGPPDHATLRDPAFDEDPLPTTDEVAALLRGQDFFVFQQALESGPHNLVHGAMGGAMGLVPSAAFDPIFWSHHAMIDAIWAAWSARNPTYVYPEAYLARPLSPFDLTVRDVVDMAGLQYRYEIMPPIA